MIYLDNQRSSEPCKAALERMVESASFYGRGPEESYEKLKTYLGCDGEHILASNSYSEILTILFTHLYEQHLKPSGRNQILQPAFENPILKTAARSLELRGCLVKEIPLLKTGELDLKRLKELLGPKVGCISLSYADDFTGVLYPVEEIVAIAKEKGIPVHLDVSGVIGKVEILKRDLKVDYLTLSGKSLHAASSLGVLIADEKVSVSCSLDLAPLEAFVSALQQALLFSDKMGLEVARLRSLLEESLEAKVGAISPFKALCRLPNVTALAFPKIHFESLGAEPEERGIFPFLESSNRMANRPFMETTHRWSCLSFALSRFTTEADVNKVIKELERLVERFAKLMQEVL